MLIDTHCHLNDSAAFPNPAATVAEAVEAGVTRMFVVGVDAEDSRRAVDLAERFTEVYAIVGWHPNHAESYSREGLDAIGQMLAHPKVVALGETGLDFHWSYATPEKQKAALLEQIALAGKLGKPVVLHCREAYPQLLDILESIEILPYLFHCFAGDEEDAKRAFGLGCYFGVDGPISFKKSGQLREILKWLPRDRIVVETDSPYLSPEPHRGKPNKPANVALVNAALASTLGMTEEECAAMTTANAERFFRLSGHGH
ncbi:MAG TPA: TatD family hydrolase [Fimbriimonadaceae bacterium]|nr:TatD family hydrolase [Fimbriimonadaceae bacterium]